MVDWLVLEQLKKQEHIHIFIHSFLPFWAAAPKGRCPVGHKGEFPYVRLYIRLSLDDLLFVKRLFTHVNDRRVVRTSFLSFPVTK